MTDRKDCRPGHPSNGNASRTLSGKYDGKPNHDVHQSTGRDSRSLHGSAWKSVAGTGTTNPVYVTTYGLLFSLLPDRRLIDFLGISECGSSRQFA
jgi:hypothetical protein